MSVLALKHIPEIAKKGILQVLNKLCSPTFIHPLPIHITFNKSNLIHELFSNFKEVPVSVDDVRMKAFHRNFKGTRHKNFMVSPRASRSRSRWCFRSAFPKR